MRPKRPFNSIIGAAAALFAVFALAALLAGAEFALPIALLALIVLAFLGVHALLANRANMVDDETPLGDTPQAHDEISPHDLPRDSPGRRAAERQAARGDGTTRGHERGGAGGRVLESDPPADAA